MRYIDYFKYKIKQDTIIVRIECNDVELISLKYVEDVMDDFNKNKLTTLVRKELKEILEGNRNEPSFKLRDFGTDKEIKIYKTISKIKYGETMSYKDVAIKAGMKNAHRFVGSAMRKNLMPIIYPCHRVVPSIVKNDNYGSFNAPGGEITKKILVEFENNNS